MFFSLYARKTLLQKTTIMFFPLYTRKTLLQKMTITIFLCVLKNLCNKRQQQYKTSLGSFCIVANYDKKKCKNGFDC